MNTIKLLIHKISKVEQLQNTLQKYTDYTQKCIFLSQLPEVLAFEQRPSIISECIKALPSDASYVVKILIAIDQADTVFDITKLSLSDHEITEKFLYLIERLLEVEVFYKEMGGLLGYHLTVLKLIANAEHPALNYLKNKKYIRPEGLYVNENDKEVRRVVRKGIENLPHIAAMYPLGGAGERLNLKDDQSNSPLPVAALPFLGRSLLEGLIRDIQGLEYLYFKLTAAQLTLPIAIMTSLEKDNHVHIFRILEKNHWFHRPSSEFYLFIQPLVPVISIDGKWTLSDPLTLNLKPSGHGVIWKIAKESGIFDWFESKGCTKTLIRQINNPLASCDMGILALIGKGFQENKAMGFLSCERLVGSDEGSNILIETKTDQGYNYTLTNIEYTEFHQKGIEDKPIDNQSPYSIFPANTNIFLVDIPSVCKALSTSPFPGQMINMKSKITVTDRDGKTSTLQAGRLESMMQNIADAIVSFSPTPLNRKDLENHLNAFIVYNERSKTISTAKKAYRKGESLLGTPEQAYFDLLKINHFLLQRCGFELPPWISVEDFLELGPPILFHFHPALGPLHSIIAQKLRKGTLGTGSELELEIAEVDIANLHVQGSLRIHASSPLGSIDSQGQLLYGNAPFCFLNNVTISNKGIQRCDAPIYWKNKLVREEEVLILLHEGAEFFAEHVELKGSHTFEVPPYQRLILRPQEDGTFEKHIEAITTPTRCWDYTINDEDVIILSRKN